MKKIILPLLLAAILAGPADAGVYTIDQYLDLVARHSKDLKQAEQDVESAAATKREAMSGALPHLSARAGYNRNLTDQYMYASLDPESDEVAKFRINRDNDYSAGAVLSQTLFSGTVFNAIKAAKQYEQLIDNVYDASYRQILTVAQQSYYQALLLKVVWEVAQKSEQNALENYEDVKGAFENGLVSEFGLLQAEARYKDAVPQTTAAERNYRIALIGLQNLAGISVDEEIILDGDLEQYPELPPAKELETVLGDRPDYSALLWEEKLRNTNVHAERSGYLPTLTGSLAYAYSASSDGWNFDEDNSAWVLGFNLSVPIFSGGATRARVQQARIDLNKSRIGIAQARDDIHKEIRSTRLRLNEAYSRISSAEAALKTAGKAFEIADATAGSGLTTQLELKDSRVVLDQATVRYAGAIFDYLVAYFDWQLVTGQVVSPGDSGR